MIECERGRTYISVRRTEGEKRSLEVERRRRGHAARFVIVL